ncbi:MAG: hypothetical protein FWC41_12810 [Firmicutes bacterium]|nr:hypothetical protein [Bacillota bacterium]
MKKLMLLLAVAGLIFVSCGNTAQPVAEEVTETNPCELMLDKWAGLEELDEEGQLALIGEMKAFLDELCKEKCEAKCKEGEEGEVKEMCPEKVQFKADWADFENLEPAKQIECINWIIEHMKKCNDKKEGCCKKEKEKACAQE